MRKYLRLTIVLGVFFGAVLFRQLQEPDRDSLISPGRADSEDSWIVVAPSPTARVPQAIPTATTVPLRSTPVRARPTPTRSPTPIAATGADPRPVMKIASVPRFADGAFTGKAIRTNYGPMQLQVVMNAGRLEAIEVVDFPDGTKTSIEMSHELIPQMIERAVTEQEWRVDIVSGATQTTRAFRNALVYALRAAAAP